jgi:hypothetical protein
VNIIVVAKRVLCIATKDFQKEVIVVMQLNVLSVLLGMFLCQDNKSSLSTLLLVYILEQVKVVALHELIVIRAVIFLLEAFQIADRLK